MKPTLLLLALAAAAITSCTSAYKTGQTPDDVYFSPQREQSEYVAVNNKDDDDRYDNSDDYYSDRQLRMKVQNRNQWSNLDEWYYNSDRYSYSYYDGFYGNNPWTANSYWNYNYNPYYSPYFNPFYSSYYSPYYSPVFYVNNPKNPNYAMSNRPRMFNLNTYNKQLINSNYVNRRVELNSAPAARNTYRYNNNYNNSRSNAGDYLRNSFNNNSSNNNNSRPSSNTSTPSSSGRSSSSSSSGSSAPVRRF
ncbi:MAG: hypothetical protein JWM28_109 [Chitinophagaceae bacterium]|nr:hypothetical protein [Chitinophagaceae bacterium]